MADDMANDGTVVTSITLNVIAGLDPASNRFKNVFDEDRTVIPGHAKHEPGNLEIPRCAIAHLRSGPSDHPGMTKPINMGQPIMTPLEKVNSMKMPFAELKGVTFTEAGKDRVVARMLVRPDLCTLNHTIHGGAIMALADSVGAAATVINLPEDAKGTTTIESKTNFIGGAKEGMTVIATATPVHRGRRTQVWQTRLETEEGKLVALVTQTQMVM